MISRLSSLRVAILLCLSSLGSTACGGAASPEVRTANAPERGPCGDFELDVERVWSSSSRTSVGAGILELGGGFDRVEVERVVTKLDTFSRTWVMMQEGLCKDALVRKLVTTEVYTRVSMCMRTALIRQQTLVAVMQSPSKEILAKFDEGLTKIGDDVRDCQEQAVYVAYESADSETVQKARAELAKAKTLQQLGQQDAAESAVAQAEVALAGVENKRLQVDAILAKATAAYNRGRGKQTLELVNEAMNAARGASYPLAEARALMLRGHAQTLTDHGAVPLASYSQAFEILSRELGTKHADTLMAMSFMASEETYVGGSEKALALTRQVLALREQHLGPQHLATLASMANVAAFLAWAGKYDEALAWYQKAMRGFEAAVGEKHRDTAATYVGIAYVFSKLGKHAEAAQWSMKGARTYEIASGPENPETIDSYYAAGKSLLDAGDIESATAYFRWALPFELRVRGAQHFYARNMKEELDKLCTKRNYQPACVKADDCPTADVGEDTPQARVEFGIADQAYQAGDYAKAACFFTRAYLTDPRPRILFNLSQSYAKLGRTREQALLLRAYLAGNSSCSSDDALCKDAVTTLDALRSSGSPF